MRALLRVAGQLWEEGQRPDDWFDVVERCAFWRHSTHPAAWEMIEDFALRDLAGPGDCNRSGGPRG